MKYLKIFAEIATIYVLIFLGFVFVSLVSGWLLGQL